MRVRQESAMEACSTYSISAYGSSTGELEKKMSIQEVLEV